MLGLKYLFKNLNFLFNEKFDIVFYSEGIHYQKFFINLAENLEKLNYKILYMSCLNMKMVVYTLMNLKKNLKYYLKYLVKAIMTARPSRSIYLIFSIV